MSEMIEVFDTFFNGRPAFIGMSNDELARAIESTNTLVRSTGTAEATYKPLADHLKQLLAIQAKRASIMQASATAMEST